MLKWEVTGAPHTEHECSEKLIGIGTSMRRRGDMVSGIVLGTHKVAYRVGDATKGYLLCLPDTVDPRGPKGKWSVAEFIACSERETRPATLP